MYRWLVIYLLTASCVWAQPLTPEQLCLNNLQTLLNAVNKYSTENQNHFPDKLDQLVPRYLNQLPKCPLENTSYTRYSIIEHDPERIVLICSSPNHQLNPPDYLLISSDRGTEQPFTHLADPSICRRSLVQLSQQVEEEKVELGHYPEKLAHTIMCSCGDPIHYQPLQEGKSFIAYCPGAAHLGSGLAPFNPFIQPTGLQENNLFLEAPSIPKTGKQGLSTVTLLLGGLALLVLLGLGYSVINKRRKVVHRVQLD